MQLECVVVGAGAAGVATSRALAEAGVEHVVLERGEVGNTWSTQRWDSFRLNTPGLMNAVLGELAPESYPTRAETIALLHERAAGLPVRTGTTVTAVRADGDGFAVRTGDEELHTRAVVVASGPKNRPLLPAMAARLAPHLTAMHTADYRNPAALPEGGVLVVGGGQSGAQIAEDLALAGRTVWLATSRIGRYRARYRGRALLAWHVDCGWWATRPEDLPDPAAMRMATPLIASGGRPLGLPALHRMGVRLLGRLADVDGTRLSLTGSVADHVAFGDQLARDLDRVADDYIAAKGIDAPPPEDDDGRGPVDVPDVPELDLDAAGISTVLWCTGFGADYSWLPASVLDPRGWPVLHGGAADGVPALRFVGLPWQSTRASAILHGMPLDVRRAVDGVTAALA